MDERWEMTWKRIMKRTTEEIPWEEGQQERILQAIHKELNGKQERRSIMTISKKKAAVLAAAALIVFGSISAVAAGKIAGLQSSTNREERLRTASEAEKASETLFEDEIYVPEQLAGLDFCEGYITRVEALDESGHVVGSYPELSASYGSWDDKAISLFVRKTDGLAIQLDQESWDFQEDYNGIQIQGSDDAYLFLPPDAIPSEEDAALEAAGKLCISYGSEQEERKISSSVTWTQDGVTYVLMNFDQYNGKELLELAKEYIDATVK